LFLVKDQCYIAFHDEEWGVPVHDDKYVIFSLYTDLCFTDQRDAFLDYTLSYSVNCLQETFRVIKLVWCSC